LQIYLKEYLPYWGDRIPYRLFWNAQYDVCNESCSTLNDKAEFLPTDIENLSPSWQPTSISMVCRPPSGMKTLNLSGETAIANLDVCTIFPVPVCDSL
jgi:hypothetical protein